jgi:nuclear pore complex protein Nup62
MLGTTSGTATPVPQKVFGTFAANSAFGGGSLTPSATPASTTGFGFGAKPADTASSTPAAKTGSGFGGGASTTPFGAPQQLQAGDKPTQSKSTFGAFGGTSTLQPTETKPSLSTFGHQTTADKSADTKPAFAGFGQQSKTDKSTESIRTFGGFTQQTTEKPAEPKQTFGGFAGTTTNKPAENKGFGLGSFASAPASVSTTPQPPEDTPATGGFGLKPATSTPATAPARYSAFKSTSTDDAMQSRDQSQQPSQIGGFGLSKPFDTGKSGKSLAPFTLGGTTESSTAATSVSGDSTDTTPAPIRKDFASVSGLVGLTPIGTPAPTDKEADKTEKKGFGFTSAPADNEGDKKTGFARFGALSSTDTAKNDDSSSEKEKTEEEKPKGFAGFGAPVDKRTSAFNLITLAAEQSVPRGAFGATTSTVQGMKNKTMEEIINKWTGELDRCGEQFKTQATDIRHWDAVLVENGDKVHRVVLC